jgi:hypothetical protein
MKKSFGQTAVSGSHTSPPLSAEGGGGPHIGVQETGTYIHCLLYTPHWAPGLTSLEVPQLLLWWKSQWPLGMAKEVSSTIHPASTALSSSRAKWRA